jgi:hypothetical protein
VQSFAQACSFSIATLQWHTPVPGSGPDLYHDRGLAFPRPWDCVGVTVDEQCALMVLPCWNRVSVYSDPSNHFCTSKLSDPNLSETSRDISKEGVPQNPDSKTLGSEPDHPLSSPCRVLSPGVAFAWPRHHTVQCTGSDSDLALFLWHWESPLLWFRDWQVAVVREHPCGRYCRQPTPE